MAAQKENEAIMQGNSVSVQMMQPWHAMTLGDLLERIGPEYFYGDLPGIENFPPGSRQSIPTRHAEEAGSSETDSTNNQEYSGPSQDLL